MKHMKQQLIIILLLVIALPVFAQESDFSDEGLSDADLTVDIEAEALPTTDSFSFGWESFMHRMRRIFTFNAEKKAELDRARLHRLDRKLTACSEIGDEDCVARIEEHIARAEEIAEKHIAKRQELIDKFQTRFEDWRTNRDARVDLLKDTATARRAQRVELLELRKANRDEAKVNRRERLNQLRNQVDISIEQRQLNRERLIETRSQRLKDNLDATRDRVQIRQDAFDNAIDGGGRRIEDLDL